VIVTCSLRRIAGNMLEFDKTLVLAFA